MGLLSFFGKADETMLQLPCGSFTVDRNGAILTKTLPSNFPTSIVSEIGGKILNAFRCASEAHLTVSELVISYSSLRITARTLRGGAIVFLNPTTPYKD